MSDNNYNSLPENDTDYQIKGKVVTKAEWEEYISKASVVSVDQSAIPQIRLDVSPFIKGLMERNPACRIHHSDDVGFIEIDENQYLMIKNGEWIVFRNLVENGSLQITETTLICAMERLELSHIYSGAILGPTDH